MLQWSIGHPKKPPLHQVFLRMMHSGASATLKKPPLHQVFLRMMHSGASATLKNLLCIRSVFKNDAQWSIGHPKKPPLHQECF